MTESDLLAAILLRFGSRPDLRLWRQNTLVARTSTGRHVRAGVPGQADISGIMLPSGRRIEIECKSATGKLRPEQVRWKAMIEKFNGLHVVARSLDDVERALQQ